jgi:hypothetical protein
MFNFIKRLFKKEEKTKTEVASPVVVHAEVSETIVIKEVALADVKKKPVAKAKGVKPAVEKSVIDNVVPLVQPVVEKATKPKKPAKPKKVVVKEDIKLAIVTPPKPKGRPKKTPTK